jgi:hypothetical protein
LFLGESGAHWSRGRLRGPRHQAIGSFYFHLPMNCQLGQKLTELTMQLVFDPAVRIGLGGSIVQVRRPANRTTTQALRGPKRKIARDTS